MFEMCSTSSGLMPSLNSINILSSSSLWGTHILLLLILRVSPYQAAKFKPRPHPPLYPPLYSSFFFSPLLHLCFLFLPLLLLFILGSTTSCYSSSLTTVSFFPLYFPLLFHLLIFLYSLVCVCVTLLYCHCEAPLEQLDVYSKLSNVATVTFLGQCVQFIKMSLCYYLFLFEISKSPLVSVITVSIAEVIPALVGAY